MSTTTDAPVDTPMTEEKPAVSEEQDAQEAVNQVQFYFHESNLPYDKFMWQLHTARPDHYVPIKILAGFKRMRQYASHGLPWLVQNLREKGEHVEVDEAGEHVRRKTLLEEPKNTFERSLYAKGFGSDEKDGQLLKDVQKFFEKWGKVNAVRFRREKDASKTFKGSVFLEYDDYAALKQCLDAPEAEKTWEGNPLIIMTKEAYCLMKMQEKGIEGSVEHLKQGGNHPSTSREKKFNAFKLPPPDPELEEKLNNLSIKIGDLNLKVKRDGTVDEKDLQYPERSVLSVNIKQEDGEPDFKSFKASIKPFNNDNAPWTVYSRAQRKGELAFNRSLSEDDIAEIQKAVPDLNGVQVEFSLADDETTTRIQTERITILAKRQLENVKKESEDKGSHKGGRKPNQKGSQNGKGQGKGRGGGGRNQENGKGSQGPRGQKRKADDNEDKPAPAKDVKGVPIVVPSNEDPAAKKQKTE